MTVRKNHVLLIVLVLFMLASSGCYWKNKVEGSQVGLILNDGVTISKIVGAGRFTDMSYYADIVKIDVSAQTAPWTDPDLVTKDKQPIGLTLGIVYARKSDSTCIRTMWETFRREAISNDALREQVLNRVPRVAKQITAGFTLDQMLGVADGEESGRAVITSQLNDLLSAELDEICVQLVDVGINNIAPSGSYLALLQRKADAQVAVEVAEKEAAQLEQELVKEQRQTDIDLEQARRENLVNEELAQTYELSDRWYELERLRLLGDVVGDNDKIYFIPAGGNLSLYLGGMPMAVTAGE